MRSAGGDERARVGVWREAVCGDVEMRVRMSNKEEQRDNNNDNEVC